VVRPVESVVPLQVQEAAAAWLRHGSQTCLLAGLGSLCWVGFSFLRAAGARKA
jgi:hypothetical protein